MRYSVPFLPGPVFLYGAIGVLVWSCGQTPTATARAVPVPSQIASFDATLVEAIQKGVRAIESEPEDPEHWLWLGKVYEGHQLHEYAAQAYQATVRIDPENPRAWYRLAISHSKSGAVDPALAAFDRVHKLAPDYVPAWRKRAQFQLDMGNPGAAQAAFESALEQAPQDSSATLGLMASLLEQGDPQAALEGLEDLDNLAPGERALRHRLRGLAFARLGREAEAQQELVLGRGARLGGADPWSRDLTKFRLGESAILLRSERLIARGQAAESIQLLTPLKESNTEDPRIWRRLATAYTMVGNHEEAARSLERACELAPGRAKDWMAAAVAQQAAGKPAEAERSCAKAFELDPTDAGAALMRADLLLRAGRADEVLPMVDQSQLKATEQAELLSAAGKACVELDRDKEALEHFQKAIHLCPRQPEPWAGKALVHLRLGSPDLAEAAITGLLERDPAHPMLAPLRTGLEGARSPVQASTSPQVDQ